MPQHKREVGVEETPNDYFSMLALGKLMTRLECLK